MNISAHPTRDKRELRSYRQLLLFPLPHLNFRIRKVVYQYRNLLKCNYSWLLDQLSYIIKCKSKIWAVNNQQVRQKRERLEDSPEILSSRL